MKPSDSVLEIDNFSIKRNKDFTLRVDKVHLQKGKVVCLVGANGSGKTTLIEAVTGLISTHTGVVRICGIESSLKNQKRVNSLMGFIPDDDNWVIPELCAEEFFALLADIYGRRIVGNIDQLCERLDFKNRRLQIGSLSHGNKKKLQIIAALAHRPKLLIVDELRNGLDPVAIIQVEQLMKDFVYGQGSILASTHDLWWAERFSDETLLIHDGKIQYADDTARIVEDYGSLENKFKQVYGLGED